MFVRTAAFYDALAAARNVRLDRACDTIARLVPATELRTRSLLDVGCESGARVAEFVRLGFTTHGIDADATLVSLARARCPDATIDFHDDPYEGTVAPGATFDVVTVLGIAAARARIPRRLDALVARLATHLAPGGTLVVEPWVAFADYRAGTIGAVFVDEPTRKIARMSLSRQVGRIGIIDDSFLAATPLGVERHFERRELGLFDEAAYRHAFEAAGLDATRADVSHDEFPHGLFLAHR